MFFRTFAEGKAGERRNCFRQPGDLVKSIRATAGKDIWLVGGGEMVREFLQKKLVNEIGISIHPRLLGDGVPLYAHHIPKRSWN